MKERGERGRREGREGKKEKGRRGIISRIVVSISWRHWRSRRLLAKRGRVWKGKHGKSSDGKRGQEGKKEVER